IIGEGDDALVKFNNGEELSRYQSIYLKTERGQRGAEQPSQLMEIVNTYPVFNFIGRAAKETSLTRLTLNSIFQQLPEATKTLLFKNPEGFSGVFITEIKNAVADHIGDHTEFTLYEGGTPHDKEELFPEVKSFPQKELTEAGARGLYDKVQLDSEVERYFVEQRLRREEDRTIFYFKFPPSFKIEMPKIIGNYNPDWGIVRYDEDGKLKLQL